MKFRAAPRGRDLRTFALDSIDVFLLSRLEDELTSEELADVSVCDAEETARRIQVLVGYGLVELTGTSPMHPTVAPPANHNTPDSRTALTLPPPQDFCAETLFDDSDPPAADSEIRSEVRNTLPFVRGKRSTR